MARVQKNKTPDYILGHSQGEMDRLIRQSSFYNEATRQAFYLAGMSKGMKVLDVGTGAGDLAMIAGEFVGPTGAVRGIDRSEDAIKLATHRADIGGFHHLNFEIGDLNDYEVSDKYDAIVGRLVLLYQSDPVKTLKRVRKLVRSGGIVLFQEFNMQSAQSIPPCSVFERATQIIRDTFARAQMDPNLGNRLFSYFKAAGFQCPHGIAFQRVFGKEDSSFINYLFKTVKSLEPFAIKHGVIDAPLDMGVWSKQLSDEITRNQSTCYTPQLVSTWTKK